MAWVAFVIVCVGWGTTYLAIRIGVHSFPPFLFAALRNGMAGVLLCSYFLAKGAKLPKGKELLHILVPGFAILFVGNGFLTWAEVYLESGVAALITSIFPFMVTLISFFMNKQDKLNSDMLVGLFLGLIGQVLIFYTGFEKIFTGENYLGVVILLLSLVGSAYGTVYQRKHSSRTNSFFVAGIHMFFASVLQLLMSLSLGEFKQEIVWSASMWYSLLYLVFIGSILTYSAYVYSIKRIHAPAFSLYAYANTVVAVLLGWLILDEEIGMLVFVAIAITFAGGMLVRRSMNSSEEKETFRTRARKVQTVTSAKIARIVRKRN